MYVMIVRRELSAETSLSLSMLGWPLDEEMMQSITLESKSAFPDRENRWSRGGP